MLARLFLSCSVLLIGSFGDEPDQAQTMVSPQCICSSPHWPSERASVEYREWIAESDLVAVGTMEWMGTLSPTKREVSKLRALGATAQEADYVSFTMLMNQPPFPHRFRIEHAIKGSASDSTVFIGPRTPEQVICGYGQGLSNGPVVIFGRAISADSVYADPSAVGLTSDAPYHWIPYCDGARTVADYAGLVDSLQVWAAER